MASAAAPQSSPDFWKMTGTPLAAHHSLSKIDGSAGSAVPRYVETHPDARTARTARQIVLTAGG